MARLTLWPTLERCIETTARREYERKLGSLLGGPADDESKETLCLLQAFLSSADFPSLRSASETELLKEKNVRFELKGAGSDVTWAMETD